jgi:hypothetical protein
MRRFLSFHWIAITDAAQGCVAAANDWQWLFGFPLLGVIIYVVNYWVGKGTLIISQDTVLGALLAAFIAFVITLGAVFIIKWLNAPAKLYYELKDSSDAEIARLENLILNKNARQAAMARLWELRKEGVELRNETIRQSDYPGWKRRYEQWESQVLTKHI